MSLLIQRGADIEKRTQRRRQTPLFYAVDYADGGTVEILLKNGAKFTELSPNTQEPALHMAGEKNDYDILQALFDYGVDVNVLDNCGNSALRGAAPLAQEVLRIG